MKFEPPLFHPNSKPTSRFSLPPSCALPYLAFIDAHPILRTTRHSTLRSFVVWRTTQLTFQLTDSLPRWNGLHFHPTQPGRRSSDVRTSVRALEPRPERRESPPECDFYASRCVIPSHTYLSSILLSSDTVPFILVFPSVHVPLLH